MTIKLFIHDWESRIEISSDASDSEHSTLREKHIQNEYTEVNWHSFNQIQTLLIEAKEGITSISNQVSEPAAAIYGIISGELTSENITGEVTLLQLHAGQYHLFYPASLINNFRIEAPSQIFIIYLPDDYLCRLLSEQSGIGAFLLANIQAKKAFITNTIPINPKIYHTINALEVKALKGHTKRILLEAKVLELLACKLDQLEKSYRQISGNGFLKAHDIDKIYYAKDIIEQNIQTPCSLIELSRKVGLNDFKLKKGFKEILGSTVFTYLSDFRMEKAKVLLEEKKSVNEVSYEVGYKNPQHFTSAFKKKFGFLPSDINR